MPSKDFSPTDNLEAITNKSKFSPVWWAKYFGLYSCQNKKGLVDVMYFGSNDIISHIPELRDDESRALDVVNMQLCAQDGLFFKKRDFSLQSLLLMMKRLIKNNFQSDPAVIECHSWARLVLIQFILEI